MDGGVRRGRWKAGLAAAEIFIGLVCWGAARLPRDSARLGDAPDRHGLTAERRAGTASVGSSALLPLSSTKKIGGWNTSAVRTG